MSHAKMYLAAAVIAASSLVATGPAFATPTPTATNLLFDDTAAGTSLIISVDGSVVNTVGPVADVQGATNSFGEVVTGAFSVPLTTISILDQGTSLESDNLQFSTINLGTGSSLTISFFGSNDVSALPPTSSNQIFETGLVQTLLSEQDEAGDTLTVQFLSEADAPKSTSNSVPEPSTLAMFGAALAALGMMLRRRVVRSSV